MFVLLQVVQIVLWYLDSGCSRHMIDDRSKLINYVEKFIATVRFENDQFTKIVGYGDYKLGDTIISRLSTTESQGHTVADSYAETSKDPEYITMNLKIQRYYEADSKWKKEYEKTFAAYNKERVTRRCQDRSLAVLYLTKAKARDQICRAIQYGSQFSSNARQGQRKTLTKQVAWLAEFFVYLRYDLYRDDLTFCTKSA
nr:peroxisomal membrane protein 11D-like [Tanacetum cinerariifolium]